VIKGQSVHVYPIGDSGWTWQESRSTILSIWRMMISTSTQDLQTANDAFEPEHVKAILEYGKPIYHADTDE